jgi:hypothetical protein
MDIQVEVFSELCNLKVFGSALNVSYGSQRFYMTVLFGMFQEGGLASKPPHSYLHLIPRTMF